MGVTLSPFRYIQVARYLLQRWLDHTPPSAFVKGKQRAMSAKKLRSASSLLAMAQSHMANDASSMSTDSAALPQQGVAGPSRPSSPKTPISDGGGGSAGPEPGWPPEPKEIYRLMNDQRLFVPTGAKPPREIVVLCHGLYGFSTATPIPLFPSLKLHYWASVLEVLRDRMGVKVLVVGVKGTGSIKERAEQMHAFLKSQLPKGTGVNFVAHSMGGLDVRHLISTIKPTEYRPVSLTTIGTPHRGSPFMDWCAANIGVGSATAAAATAAIEATTLGSNLPFSLKSPLLSRPPMPPEGKSGKNRDESSIAAWTNALTSYLLNIFDSPAYSNLTTGFLRDHFNPRTPDSPDVKYISVAGRASKMSVLHPLWFPKLVLDSAAEKRYLNEPGKYEGNDGLVNVSSAKWGEFLGVVDDCHHWDLRGEGGLFPQGGSIGESSKKDGSFSPSPSQTPGSVSGTGTDGTMPGGWDWGSLSGVGEHLGLASGEQDKMRQHQTEMDAELRQRHAQEKDAGKAGTSPSASSAAANKSDPSSWDIAQVGGDVFDWVMDLLPGGKGSETGKKQLEDAKREKEQAVARSQGKSPSDDKRDEEKRRKDKFDLARFYGGLMLKLREDGF